MMTLYCKQQSRGHIVDYMDLIKAGVDSTDIRKFLVEGETVAVTIRIPKNLRDSAKEAASCRGTSFSALVRECVIDGLSKRD